MTYAKSRIKFNTLNTFNNVDGDIIQEGEAIFYIIAFPSMLKLLKC